MIPRSEIRGVPRLRRLTLGGFVLAAAWSAGGCGEKDEAAKAAKAAADAKPKVVTITVAPVERRSVERTVEAVGTLKGWEDVTVGTKKRGRVVRVLHDMGDKIAPGAPLVELDAVDANLAVMQSERQHEADLAKLGLTELPANSKEFDVSKVPAVTQARVSLDRARINLERQKSLTQRKAGTYQDLQNAENDEQGAVAALENAQLVARSTLAMAQWTKASLDAARQNRADMVIRAPIPSAPPGGKGKPIVYQMSKRSASEGQMLGESDPVATLVVQDPLRLWVNVPERFSTDVALGQAAKIRVAAFADRTFEGKVARINPSVDSTSRTFQAEIAVPNPEGKLRPGGFAKASILTHVDTQAVIVPLESVVKFAGVTKLFIVKDKAAHAIPVETGPEGDGWVEVFGKVPDDAQVITSGFAQIAEGTSVVVREKPKAETPEAKPKPAPTTAGL